MEAAIVVVILMGLIPHAVFYCIQKNENRSLSCYWTPGLLAAGILAPTAAIAIGAITIIRHFVNMSEVGYNQHSLVQTLRNSNRPLLFGLTLAFLLCIVATYYLRGKLSWEPRTSKNESFKIPVILSTMLLVLCAVSFLIYFQGLLLIYNVLVEDPSSGQEVGSVARNISVHLQMSVLAGLVATLSSAILAIACLFFNIGRADNLPASHLYVMYAADILILAGLFAGAVWYQSLGHV